MCLKLQRSLLKENSCCEIEVKKAQVQFHLVVLDASISKVQCLEPLIFNMGAANFK